MYLLSTFGDRWGFRKKFSSCLPSDYVTFDVELTGISPKKDLIVQIGHCEVRSGQLVAREEAVLDWTKSPEVDQEWLESRLLYTRRAIEYGVNGMPTGEHYPIDMDLLRDEGLHPLKSLRYYAEKLNKWCREGMYVVGHNLSVDEDAMEANVARWFEPADLKFNRFPDNQIIDTGGLAKATQSGYFPGKEKTLREYFTQAKRKGGSKYKWGMTKYCIPTFLEKQASVDQAHSASYDALLCHWLIEEFRGMGDSQPTNQPSQESPPIVESKDRKPAKGGAASGDFDGLQGADKSKKAPTIWDHRESRRRSR